HPVRDALARGHVRLLRRAQVAQRIGSITRLHGKGAHAVAPVGQLFFGNDDENRGADQSEAGDRGERPAHGRQSIISGSQAMRIRTFIVVVFLASAIAAVASAQPSRGVAVTGTVQDQTGAVLPGATVSLTPAGSTTPVHTIVSDTAGAFRIDRVAAGTYDLTVEFPGFKTNVTRLRVGARAPAPSTVVMQIEGLAQEVSVSGGGNETSSSGAANLDAVSVDAAALDNMPVLDDDVAGAVSRFLDASAIGTNGATLVVDGVEVNALSVSSSAV